MGRTKAPSFLDRLIGYDGPQPLTDEATAELRAEGVRNADRIPGGRIDAKMVRDPSLVDRLTGYDGPQPLTPEGEKAFAAMHEAENAPVRIQPIDLGYMPEDETQVTPDWGMDLTDVKAPRQPRVSVRHATADTSDMVQRMSDRLQALVDPSSQTTQQQTATADAGEVRPGSMKGFFQNAITGTGTPTDARKPLVPPEVAAFVAKQTGTTLPTPDADAMAEAKRRAGLGDTLASLTDQLEIANGKFDAGRSARLHANAQQPVTDEKAKQDAVRAFVERKLGLERQARQDQRQSEMDALNTRNIESQIAARERAKQPAPTDPLDAEKKRAEIAKLQAETERLNGRGRGSGASGGTGQPSPKDQMDELRLEKLRQEVTGENPAKVRDAEASADRLRGLIKRMRGLYDTYGTEYGGKGGDLMNQVATQIQIEAKNLAGLGALSGPDQVLMEKLAGSNPASIGANVKAVIDHLNPVVTLTGKGRLENTPSTLSGVEDWVNDAEQSARHIYGPQNGTAAAPTPTGRTKTDRNGVVWEELSDGTARRKEG